MAERTIYDIGDPEPNRWGKSVGGDWKGYKNGGKVYMDWADLVRYWGPLKP